MLTLFCFFSGRKVGGAHVGVHSLTLCSVGTTYEVGTFACMYICMYVSYADYHASTSAASHLERKIERMDGRTDSIA